MKELITDFSFGELSRKLEGRVDLPVSRKGAAELYNMYVMPQGPASRMPGTKFVKEVKDSSNKIGIIEMEISEDTAYVIELGNIYMRFCKDGVQIESGGSPYEIVTTYLTADLFDIKYAQIDNVIYLVHPSYPVRTLTWTSDTSWAIADMSYEAGSVDFATADNYPSVIAVYEGRLLLGATNNQPQWVWGSKSMDIDCFIPGTGMGDSWSYDIGGMDKLLWLVACETLTAGTASGEISVYSEGGISPVDVPRVKRISTFGSKNIQAKLIGLSLLFIQKAGRKIREFAYQSTEGALASPDLTIYADHITESGVVSFAYQQDPVQSAWFVKGDGYLIGLSFDRSTGLMAWHRHWVGGVIESIAVVPGATEDMVYVVVKRTINGSAVRYIEYFTEKEMDEKEDYFYVHCGITVDNGSGSSITGATQANPVVITSIAHGFSTDDYVKISGVVGMTLLNDRIYRIIKIDNDSYSLKTDTNIPVDGAGYDAYSSGGLAKLVTSTMTGLDHLEGEEVSVYADGGVQANKTVSSGSIILEKKANKIQIGLPYQSRIKTMRLRPELVGDKKIISKVFIRFFKTIGCKVGSSLEKLQEINFREPGLDLSAPDLFTGDKAVNYAGSYDSDNFIYIVQDEPLPMTICAISPEYSTGGRK